MSRATELGLGDTYGQLDETPTLCTDCSEESVYGFEVCSGGLCPTCCKAESCHVLCTRCARRVDGADVCSCCGRCDLHDCRKDEDDARREDAADEARGDLIAACRKWRAKRESAVGGAL